MNVAVFNDTRPARHVGCSLVMRELIALSRHHGMEPVWFHPVRADWRKDVHTIPRPPQIDAIIVNGEGSIHHSLTRPRAVFLSELGSFARHQLGIPAFLINATIEEIDTSVAENLRAFYQIYVREASSLQVLQSYGIRSEVVPDLTLHTRLPIAEERNGVCGTDSVIPEVKKAIRQLCRANGWSFRRMSSAWDESISDVAAQLVSESYAHWLSEHDLVITGRFHTVTLCVVTRTPFLAIESNTRKISSFVNDVFGSCERVVQVDDLKNLDWEKYAQWSSKENSLLNCYLSQASSSIQEMFKNISKSIKSD